MKTKLLLLCWLFTGCSFLVGELGADKCSGNEPSCEDGILTICEDDFIRFVSCGEESCSESGKSCGQCGDGVLSVGEVCDVGNDSSCRADCLGLKECGNGFLEENEDCDDGNTNPGDGCSQLCKAEILCGDGVLAGNEICDDRNNLNGDGCRADCLGQELCGDGLLDTTEVCDDNNTAAGDGCRNDCQKIERCGDGTLDVGEICDDGNNVPGDGCNVSCTGVEVCGDDILDSTAGEECEPPLVDNCDAQCKLIVSGTCGNGNLEIIDEVCDDGNNSSGDGCRSDCRKIELCGDGELDAGELCDDGNQISGDGCAEDCKQIEQCGDGIIQAGEDCELNQANCSSNCKFLCDDLAADGRIVLSENHCYLSFTQTPLSWPAAKTQCESFGGNLVAISSAQENGFVRSLNTQVSFWIGLRDEVTEGKFEWVTNEREGLFNNFAAGEPNNANNQDCARINDNNLLTWDDFQCTSQLPYVCELEFAPVCGNKISEKNEACDDGNTSNDDGCNANCSAFNCAQFEATPNTDDVVFNNVTDQCYVLFNTRKGWQSASSDCAIRGGHLASIRNQAENDLLDNMTVADAWIGFNDNVTENIFAWDSGETEVFRNFTFGEPNNQGNSDCVILQNFGGAEDEWSDRSCNDAQEYICEF